MIEGGFFQAIQHEASAEAGIEEDVQGTVEVVVRDGFAYDTDALLRSRVQVLHDLDGGGGDHFAVDRGCLSTKRHPVMIETGVSQGEDKTAAGPDDLANAAHQGIDLSHVHEGHIADGCVEALLPKGHDLLLASGIQQVIGNAAGMFGGTSASAFEELRAEVSSDDFDTKLGHAAGEDTIATGDL